MAFKFENSVFMSWKDKKEIFLLAGGLILLFLNLGQRPLWGAEGRWAEAVREMLLRVDFWVPTLNGAPHLTKPLLPYWLLMLSAKIFGHLNEWTVRLPAAISGILTLVFFYLLSRKFLEKGLALLATGLFLTSYGFFYYARLTQSEIYQLLWVTAALAWYVHHREEKSFKGYLIFWLLVDLAALSKGLTGMAVPCLVVLMDWLVRKDTKHLNLKALLATLLGFALYFLHYYGIARASGSTLPFYLIIRENLLQAVSPYDHREPFYVYLIYWPELLLPWTPFLFLALGWAFKNWQRLSPDTRWILAGNLAVFFLFTLARCRRFYYILPIFPLSILLISVCLQSYYLRFKRFLWGAVWVFLAFEIIVFAILQPILSSSSEKAFGESLSAFLRQNPSLQVCVFKKASANLFFYLNLPRPVPVLRELGEVKDCDLLFFRERYYQKEPLLRERAQDLWGVPEKLRSKDPNKNYLLWILKEGNFSVPGLISIHEGTNNEKKSS